MILNYGDGEASCEPLGLQGDPTSQSKGKSFVNIQWKYWSWSWSSHTWPPDVNNWLIGRDPDAGKSWRQQDKGMTEDVMVGWHDQLDGYEFEQAPGVGDGTRKPGMLPSVASQRVRHDWALNWTETDIKRLAKKEWGGILSAPFWCLCQKLPLCFLYFNKALLHKTCKGSSLVSDPRLQCSPQKVTDPGVALGSRQQTLRNNEWGSGWNWGACRTECGHEIGALLLVCS